MTAKCLVFVTGASQGIGRCIAMETAKRFLGDLVFALTARSEAKLNETKNAILKIKPDAVVKTFPLDLKNAQKAHFDDFLQQITPLAPFDACFLFHNAGQTGDIKNALSLSDLNFWHDYFHLNYFSAIALTISFVEKLKPLSQKIAIINVTSLIGRQPFANFAMYGSGKAARDLYFRVLAKEDPTLLVLNYSPGPVDTDMFNGVISTAESEEMRKQFAEMKENKQVLTPEQTVGKLLDLLEKKDFESGAIIDYFDRV